MPQRRQTLHHTRSDGFQVVGVGSAASVELYFGERSLVAYALNYRTAFAVLRFLLRWWVLDTWCGLRGWYQARKLDRQLDRKAASWPKP